MKADASLFLSARATSRSSPRLIRPQAGEGPQSWPSSIITVEVSAVVSTKPIRGLMNDGGRSLSLAWRLDEAGCDAFMAFLLGGAPRAGGNEGRDARPPSRARELAGRSDAASAVETVRRARDAL